MSFRLEFDAADLHRTAGLLEEAVEVARRVDGSAGRMAGQVSDCGHSALADACSDFLDDWGHGMKVVAEDADGLAGALRDAVTAYTKLDAAGAAALE